MRQPFVVEFRFRSKRTRSGYTKWRDYIVSPTREDAERTVASLAWWCRFEDGQLRIVDREAQA